MIPGNYDLQEYYNSPQGRFVLRCLKRKIERIWPVDEMGGLVMAGFGYCFPYLDGYRDEAEVFAMVARRAGPYHWPNGAANRVVLCRRGEWPFPKESMDRILVIHDGEYSSGLQGFLSEVWRVLKPNGRLLMVVPNRKGAWARSDQNPFGHGAPYSFTQVRDVLRECHFVYEGAQGALLTPPLRRHLPLRALSLLCEPLSGYCPSMSGVYLVEASKRLYAMPPAGKTIGSNIRKLVWPAPAAARPATGFNLTPYRDNK